MKKLLGIVVLCLLLSGNAYAKAIYCYKANKGNEILKSTIATDLIDSSSIYFFEINDKSKNVEWLKYYWEYKEKLNIVGKTTTHMNLYMMMKINQ